MLGPGLGSMGSVLRGSVLRSSVLRRFSSTYYDSQSGEHVTLAQGVHLHAVSGAVRWDADVHFRMLRAAGLASVELHRKTDMEAHVWGAPSDVLVPFVRIADRLALDGVAQCRDYGWPPHNNIGVVVAVPLCEPDTMAVSGSDPAIELARAAKAAGLRVRASLLDAFGADADPDPDPEGDLQLIAAQLADEGCEAIILDDRRNHLGTVAEEAPERLERALEAATWCDVVGVPMSERVGVRLAGTPAGLEMTLHALSLGMKHAECCPFGEAAPHVGAVIRACKDAGTWSSHHEGDPQALQQVLDWQV